MCYISCHTHNDQLAAFSKEPIVDFLISSILQTTQKGVGIGHLIFVPFANSYILHSGCVWWFWSFDSISRDYVNGEKFVQQKCEKSVFLSRETMSKMTKIINTFDTFKRNVSSIFWPPTRG